MTKADATKRCSHCKERKPLSEFAKNRTKWDGLQDTCKSCKALYHRTRHQRAAEAEQLPHSMKRCSKCGIVKAFSDYYKQKSGKHGRTAACIECCCAKDKRKRDANRKKRKRYKAELAAMGLKKCAACGQVKFIEDFGVETRRKDGRLGACKTCIHTRQKRHRKTPKGRELARRWSESEQGKASARRRVKRWQNSVIGMALRQLYEQTPKVQQYRQAYRNSDSGKAYQKQWRRTEEGKRALKECYDRWKEKRPDMHLAHKTVNAAVRAGILPAISDLTCRF